MKNKLKKTLKNKFLGIVEPSTDKTKSLIILVVGFLIMLILFVFIRINYHNFNKQLETNNTIKEETKFLSLKDLFAKYNDSYEYNITILDNESYVYYIGKVINEENVGKRIIDAENIDNLYKNYLYFFFTPSNLYDYLEYLKPEETINSDTKTYTFKSIYNNEALDIKLTTTIESIKEINYNYNNITYNIKLS